MLDTLTKSCNQTCAGLSLSTQTAARLTHTIWGADVHACHKLTAEEAKEVIAFVMPLGGGYGTRNKLCKGKSTSFKQVRCTTCYIKMKNKITRLSNMRNIPSCLYTNSGSLLRLSTTCSVNNMRHILPLLKRKSKSTQGQHFRMYWQRM